jgi:oxaloacetate decarboxylase (Na+ extruding) subunit gamma
VILPWDSGVRLDAGTGVRFLAMTDLLMSGLELMLLGMAVVFVLLGMLVLAAMAMSRIVARWEPLPAPAVSGPPGEVSDEVEQIVAATAAVHAYRTRWGAGR